MGISKLFFVLGCLASSTCPFASAEEDLQQRVDAVINAPPFQQSHWGLLVVDRQTGEVLYEQNADKLFAPASTTKLFSVAAALAELGPDYRFETRIVRTGSIDPDGILTGDLILVASGDLTLGGRTLPDGTIAYTNVDHIYANGSEDAQLTNTDPLAGLNRLARQVAAAGIRRVDGNIHIDDRLFERERGSGSGPETITPIIINDNLIDVTIRPTEVGEDAALEWRPAISATRFRNYVQTVPADGPLDVTIRSEFRQTTIEGTIPAGHAPLVRVYETRFPTLHARTLLIDALNRAGVEVAKDSSRGWGGFTSRRRLPPSDEIAQMPVVARFTSPPFSESAKLILKVSHNLHASTLPMLLAVRHGHRTLDEGLRVQAQHLQALGVDTDSISFGGGAGGSRADYVTPRATVELLLAVAEQPYAETFHNALPILGVDGTLADDLPHDSPVRGKVQAKTGTLYWQNLLGGSYILTSKALAGYATTKTGRELAFSFLVNNAPLKDRDDANLVGQTLAKLCEVFYDMF